MKAIKVTEDRTGWLVGNNDGVAFIESTDGRGFGRRFFIGWPNKPSARKLADALDGRTKRASFQSNGIVWRAYRYDGAIVIEAKERAGFGAMNLSRLSKAQAKKLAKALRQAAREIRRP